MLAKLYETFVSSEDKNIKVHAPRQCCSVWKAPARQTVKVKINFIQCLLERWMTLLRKWDIFQLINTAVSKILSGLVLKLS